VINDQDYANDMTIPATKKIGITSGGSAGGQTFTRFSGMCLTNRWWVRVSRGKPHP